MKNVIIFLHSNCFLVKVTYNNSNYIRIFETDNVPHTSLYTQKSSWISNSQSFAKTSVLKASLGTCRVTEIASERRPETFKYMDFIVKIVKGKVIVTKR